jgi:Arc/MetJ-type ribon-helix-helix transcriptional regulator
MAPEKSGRDAIMRNVTIELPERVSREVEAMVKAGWFDDDEEVLRFALAQFLRRYRAELVDRFEREDIAWATPHKALAS